MMAADAGMDTTCPSPEIPNDSRKRPLDADSDNGSTKRSHFSGESQKAQKKPKKKSLVDVEKLTKKTKVKKHNNKKERKKKFLMIVMWCYMSNARVKQIKKYFKQNHKER